MYGFPTQIVHENPSLPSPTSTPKTNFTIKLFQNDASTSQPILNVKEAEEKEPKRKKRRVVESPSLSQSNDASPKIRDSEEAISPISPNSSTEDKK